MAATRTNIRRSYARHARRGELVGAVKFDTRRLQQRFIGFVSGFESVAAGSFAAELSPDCLPDAFNRATIVGRTAASFGAKSVLMVGARACHCSLATARCPGRGRWRV
jgi:hypothetical protein